MSDRSVAERLASLTCVMLDLDGVLFSGTNQGYFDCHAYALESVGVDIPREDQRRRLLDYWSHPHEFQLSLFIQDSAKLALACKAYEEYLFSEEFSARITEIPGAAEAVRRLIELGFQLGAASGMHHHQIPFALRRIGIDPDTFAVCLSAYQLPDDELQKPNPYMLKKILEHVNAAPEDGLYVGDSRDDIRMAKAADVLAVAVLTGNMSPRDAAAEQPDLTVRSIRELPNLIEAGR